MNMTELTTIVSLLIALSIASERLVEIVKGFTPWLDQQQSDPKKEGQRRAVLQLLAVGAGIGTAFLAGPMIPKEVYDATTPLGTVALGLLASGGSGFWNSVLTYVTKVKDVKKLEADAKHSEAEEKRAAAGPYLVHADLNLSDEQVTSNECYDVEDK
ncbi:MAG: hypothetical protein HOP18_05315 [Deltaproteobacteria bacterium]|nr:hypothetical protein [Deltaproteobacteria bacterium]